MNQAHIEKYFLTCLLFSFICSGCLNTESEEIPANLQEIKNLTVYSSNVSILNRIYLDPVQVFEESGGLIFGRISGIAVDESERVYLSDSSQRHSAIHVFNADGSYRRSLGGYGEGPGEFKSIVNPQIMDQRLYALDTSQLKINVYSLQNFSHESTIQLNPARWHYFEELIGSSPYDFIVLDGNRIILSFIKSDGGKDLLSHYIINSSGEIISDKIMEQILAEYFVHPDNNQVFYSPFTGYGLLFVSNENILHTIYTGEILFSNYSINGEYMDSFYYPFTKKKLNRDEVLNHYESESYRVAVRNTGIPKYWPAVHSVVMDDLNNFWISTIIDDEGEFEWWLLNSRGEMTSKFRWPNSKSIRIVKNDAAYVLETEPGSGLQKVVKYQILSK